MCTAFAAEPTCSNLLFRGGMHSTNRIIRGFILYQSRIVIPFLQMHDVRRGACAAATRAA